MKEEYWIGLFTDPRYPSFFKWPFGVFTEEKVKQLSGENFRAYCHGVTYERASKNLFLEYRKWVDGERKVEPLRKVRRRNGILMHHLHPRTS